MEACSAVLALAAEQEWLVRREERLPLQVRSGEVVVAMAPVWVAIAAMSPGRLPRGLCLVAEIQESAVPMPGPCPDSAAVVQAWPCDASVLLEHLSQLMAPAFLCLDAPSRVVSHRGQFVHLTPKECRILEVLMARAGEAVAREVLEGALHVWGQEFESNTLDVHVHRLRRKLPDAGIRAVRGYGYVLISRR